MTVRRMTEIMQRQVYGNEKTKFWNCHLDMDITKNDDRSSFEVYDIESETKILKKLEGVTHQPIVAQTKEGWSVVMTRDSKLESAARWRKDERGH